MWELVRLTAPQAPRTDIRPCTMISTTTYNTYSNTSCLHRVSKPAVVACVTNFTTAYTSLTIYKMANYCLLSSKEVYSFNSIYLSFTNSSKKDKTHLVQTYLRPPTYSQYAASPFSSPEPLPRENSLQFSPSQVPFSPLLLPILQFTYMPLITYRGSTSLQDPTNRILTNWQPV